MNSIRILIVDDHAILRMGLVSLLGTRPEVEVVGDASGGASALRKYAKLKPDVVIMDLVMPGMDGIETTKALLEREPGARVMILTTFGTSEGISRALEAGAKGAVLKSASLTELLCAIRKTAAGERYVSPEIEGILTENPPIQPLSPRQKQILDLLVRGFSNSDIARNLGISLDMVKEHVIALYGKLGAANRTEATAVAIKHGLVES